MGELEHIPRRKRRFYRDQNKKLMKHLSKHVKKAEGIKEIEKQKIILSLKKQLERVRREEIKEVAAHLFEQAAYGKDETKELVFKEVLKYQDRAKELSGKEADEIAESIYSQLKEKKEAQRMFDRLEEKKRKETEKLERKKEKLAEKKEGLSRLERKKARDLKKLGFEPEKAGRIEAGYEVEKIKEELTKGLETEEEKEAPLLKEITERKGELGEAGEEKSGKDEFSMEGFTTDFGFKKKEKKEIESP